MGCQYDQRERVGALFQQTTLVDALSVGGNVANALAACGVHSVEEPKRLVERWAWIGRGRRKMPQAVRWDGSSRVFGVTVSTTETRCGPNEPFTGADGRAAGWPRVRVLRREHGLPCYLVVCDLVKLVCDAPRSKRCQL